MIKIISFIFAVWFFFKIKKIIKGIEIISSNVSKPKVSKKIDMDIQDGDFEEVK